MKIVKGVVSGTEEKSDVRLVFSPCEAGRQIEIRKIPHLRFIESELKLIHGVLDRYGIEDVHLEVWDYGALDFALEARLIAGIELERGNAIC